MKIDLECDLNSLFSRALVDLEAKTRKMFRVLWSLWEAGDDKTTKQNRSTSILLIFRLSICGVEQFKKKITALRTFVCPRAVDFFARIFGVKQIFRLKVPAEIKHQCKTFFSGFVRPIKSEFEVKRFLFDETYCYLSLIFCVQLNIELLLRIWHRGLSNGWILHLAWHWVQLKFIEIYNDCQISIKQSFIIDFGFLIKGVY